jgi:hypothetical protein
MTQEEQGLTKVTIVATTLIFAAIGFLATTIILPQQNRTVQDQNTTDQTYFVEPTNQSCTIMINSYSIPIRYHFNNATCQEGIKKISQNAVTDYTVQTDKDNVTFTKNKTGIQILKERGRDEYLPVIKSSNETSSDEEKSSEENV